MVQIGELISSALARVGRQGVVTMEESRTAMDSLHVVEGMQFERGYISPYFVTDPERMVRAQEQAIRSKQRMHEHILNVMEGMQFERGCISPYFLTDPERMVRYSRSRRTSLSNMTIVADPESRLANPQIYTWYVHILSVRRGRSMAMGVVWCVLRNKQSGASNA